MKQMHVGPQLYLQSQVMTVLARVYLVRHGETDANREGIIQGQMDTPLNNRGEQQAKLVGEALRSIPFDTAYSSDLARASKVQLTNHSIDRIAKNNIMIDSRANPPASSECSA
jgi:bisphosphoglycerate-dependent phosphoglycerate mutase